MKPFLFPSIGVDISDESFKYLRLEDRHKHKEIAFYGDHDFPKGLIESGEITNAAEVARILKETLAPWRRTFPYLILSLPEEKGFLRLVEMQAVAESEVRGALEFQLEEHIPFPPSELYFDFQILPPRESQKGKMNLVVTAYPKKIVESYMEVVEKAGFLPVVFELESQAVARAVVPESAKDTAVLVGDIGRTRTTYSIVYQGAVHFTSTIKTGGRDIDAVLTEALHISPEQAAEVKIGRGLDYSSEEIIKSLSPALSLLRDEASRQISFWEHRIHGEEPVISAVYLCGGDAHLKGLPEYLSNELKIPALRARIWESIFDINMYVPSITSHKTLRYATAFGLAMRGDNDLFKDRMHL